MLDTADKKTYVYILATYDEYGCEDVVATLDRSKLIELVRKNWLWLNLLKPNWPQTISGSWIEEVIDNLSRHLKESDANLASHTGGNDCHDGSGGIKFYVVALQ